LSGAATMNRNNMTYLSTYKYEGWQGDLVVESFHHHNSVLDSARSVLRDVSEALLRPTHNSKHHTQLQEAYQSPLLCHSR
jgi:hypothetical protein